MTDSMSAATTARPPPLTVNMLLPYSKVPQSGYVFCWSKDERRKDSRAVDNSAECSRGELTRVPFVSSS